MEKYLGNKRVLLNDIKTFADINCPDANSVLDIFSGTTNVARMFKNEGYITYSNDANRFSKVLGETYLGLKDIPKFENLKSFMVEDSKFLLHERLQKDLLKNYIISELKAKEIISDSYANATKLFNFLNNLDKTLPFVEYTFLNYYTQFGSNSSYKSVRGTEGKRNYFSKENAIKLDNILYYLKEWYASKLITESEYNFILTAILEEVVLIANVNGTFHDFNRNRLWPNALQEMYLKLPAVYTESGPQGFAFCDDALVVASNNNIKVDLLYIDPPYNFRQYTAYYHLLNFIAHYIKIEDLNLYLDNLKFVRGQNPDDDFTSDFCFKDKFMQALDKMICDVSPKYIIMSYYGGRNHWNHWSKNEEAKDIGFNIIQDYFQGSKYCEHSYSSVVKLRQNYQSRVGEKKKIVDEYLFFAKLN